MNAFDRFFPAAPAPGAPGDPGIFGPGSAAWRINRERAILAGGPAALLLQVAHPLVGEGVRAHSGFTGDPLQRLRGTLDAVLTVSFGDGAQVRSAVDSVARKHGPVRGSLPEPTRSLPAGTSYRANDPALSLWVFSTLVWSALEVTHALLRPVPPEERDAYYQDMTQMARLFNVTEDLLPEDYASLERYVDEQLGATLDVGSTARLIARQILDPEPPIVPRPLRPLASVLAAGVLPSALREAYALPWRRRDRAAFAVLRRASRVAAPWLPARVRYWPHYGVAADRASRGRPRP